MNRRARRHLALSIAALAAGIALLGAAPGEPPATAPEPEPATQPATGATRPARAKLGERVPDFTLRDSEGTERTLSGSEGRIVVLEWFEPECPYVDDQHKRGRMRAAYEAVKGLDRSVAWFAINSTTGTTPEKNEFWKRQYLMAYPILIDADGEARERFNARSTPHMFVIDKQGVLRYHGAIDDNELGAIPPEKVTNHVVNAVRQLVQGEPVMPDHVKPYGSRIKSRK